MVSFQQQWEAAMSEQDRSRPRSPLRHAVILLAIAVVLITVPTIALARVTESHATESHATESHSTVHGCGVVQKTVGVTEQGGVACSRARLVANRWLAGHDHPGGFTCHRKRTDAGSGFEGVCTDTTRHVTIIPQ
jgi:hypothetical protein